ncbi:MAG: PAS domain S-box protein, partial [Myxococcales bacterium]|nr:PAS domain S-box protein [Myxococcales bacterium]
MALVVASPGAAADAPEPHTRVTSWGLRDGLPQSSVTALVQSRDGYLWVGTFGGLARFDGVRFVVFDLANTPGLAGHRVVALAEDAAGTLWIGSEDGGLARYRDGTFESIGVEGLAGLPSVSDIAFGADGTVWAASSEGLLRVTGDAAVVVPTRAFPATGAERAITGVAVTADGRVWAATVTRSACVAGPCDGAPKLPGGARVGGFGVVADDGSRWFSTSAGLFRIDAAGALTTERPVTAPVTYHASAVALDGARGRVYVAAGNALWMREGVGPWVPYHERLPTSDTRDAIRSLLVDREGGLWIGRDRHGLTQVLSVETTRYGQTEGLGLSAFAVLEDGAGRQWVTGNCAGPFVRDHGGHFAPVSLPTDAFGCAQGMALGPDGAVWVGDQGRLVRIGREVTTLQLPDPIRTETPRAFIVDPDGTFWIAGGWQAALVEIGADRVVRHVYGADDGLGGVFVSAIVPDGAGGLWLGTHRGLFHRARDGALAHWGPEDGLARGVVRDIHVDADGAVWVGTYGGGLSHLVGGAVRNLTSSDGLCDDTVSRILDDGRGNLWTNGNRGVSRIARADLDDFLAGRRADVRCTLFDSGEGNGGVQPAGYAGRDGRVWFPTIDGVVSIDPARAHADPVEPLAHIEAVSIDGEGVAVPAGGALGEMSAGRGDVTVRYTGLHFELPTQVTFRHRLLGYNADWIDDGSERTLSYTNLPPGEYELEVAAHSPRGAWSAPAKVTFTLAPHLWETTLFRVLAALLLLGLLAGLAQLRVRAVRRRNLQLREEVAERQRAEERSREQEHRYRTLFEGANNGLFVHDASGRLVEVNPAACALVGAAPAELVARGLAAWLTEESRAAYERLLASAPESEADAPVDVVLVRADGDRRELSCQASPFDLRGVPHALVTAVDLSEVRRAEAERLAYEQHLQQVQKLEALGLLAG